MLVPPLPPRPPRHTNYRSPPSHWRHANPSRDYREPPMKWAVYKEIYVSLQRVTHKSGHPENVRRVLDRFTHYCNLIGADLEEISQHDFDMYVARRREDEWRGKPISNRTINNEIDILNAAFAKAGPKLATRSGRENYGYLETTPPFKQPLEEDESEPVCVGGETIAAFMRAVTDHARVPNVDGCTPYNFWLCVLLLGGITGLRRGALLQIPRPDDVMLRDRRELVLPAHLNKARTGRRRKRKPLRFSLGRNDRVIELLVNLPSKPGEQLLPWRRNSGRPMTLGYFSNTMAEIQRAAGISDADRLKLKYLRSTAGTEIADVFGDAVAKKKLGHSPTTNTLDTNYKSRAPREKDIEASDHLANMILPFIEPRRTA